MPLILIMFTLVSFSACKKENFTSEVRTATAFQKESFTEVNAFQLRKKLLNGIVDSTQEISKEDEMEIFSHLDSRDQKDYNEKEKLLTKVIVSYPESTAVYFLPSGIPIDALILELGLTTTPERTWKWLKDSAGKTQKGTILYLINLNHDDLIANDQDFFEEIHSGHLIKTDSGRKVEITVNYNFFIQQEVVKTFIGRSIRCEREMREDGSCIPCTYNRLVPSDEYKSIQGSALDDLGLRIRVNGRLYLPSELTINIKSLSQFAVELKLNLLVSSKEVEIELVQLPSKNYQVTSEGFNYSRRCMDLEITELEIFQTRAEINFILKLRGRGEALRKILL